MSGQRCRHGLRAGTCASCIDIGEAERPADYMPDRVKNRKVKAVKKLRPVRPAPPKAPAPKPIRPEPVRTPVVVVPDGFDAVTLAKKPEALIDALSEIARCGACRGLLRCEPGCGVPGSRRQEVARRALSVAPKASKAKKLKDMVSRLPESFVAADAQSIWRASRAKAYAWLRELASAGLIEQVSGRGVRGKPVIWRRT